MCSVTDTITCSLISARRDSKSTFSPPLPILSRSLFTPRAAEWNVKPTVVLVSAQCLLLWFLLSWGPKAVGSECEDYRDERGREWASREKPCSIEQPSWKWAASHCCLLYLFCILPRGKSLNPEVKGVSKGPRGFIFLLNWNTTCSYSPLGENLLNHHWLESSLIHSSRFKALNMIRE